MNTVQYADVETSSPGYAARFGGAAGAWLLSVQSRIFLEQLNSLWVSSNDPVSVLDVGGGHGQIVTAIRQSEFRARCKITVLGSTTECQEGLSAEVAAGICSFTQGDLLNLPYPDRFFDVVTSFRFIPHCDEWPRHIRELCRVARRAVIVDYPTYISVNCLSPLLFQLKRKIEKNTRAYTLFSHAEIAAAFASAGFQVAAQRGEFFLPMVIHRSLKRPTLSSALEFPFSALGLTNIFGSPIIVRAVPQGV